MTVHPPTRRAEFWHGVRATLPLVAGAIPFGIIFGALGINSGLTPAGTMGMSLFVFAGSAQFIAAGLLAEGLSASLIIFTTFIVNLRHALYGASLSPYMKHLSQRWLLPFGFLLTDESYAAAILYYTRSPPNPYQHYFYLGSVLAMYINWQACTLIGILAGQRIPNAENWGLDVAMYVTFIGIIIPLIKNKPVLITVLTAGTVALLANGVPNKLGLMIAALAGIMAGLLAELVFPVEKMKEAQEVSEEAGA